MTEQEHKDAINFSNNVSKISTEDLEFLMGYWQILKPEIAETIKSTLTGRCVNKVMGRWSK